jgi:preprotein translocase subunit SecE
MAVAEDEKVEKAEKAERGDRKAEKASRADAPKSGSGEPGAVAQVVGWLPNKWRELRTFLSEVRSELKKVTWPGRKEVYATTIVVMATTVFFGFYLWGLDIMFSRVLSQVLKR